MLKQRARLFAAALLAVDLALAGVAFLAAYWVRGFLLPTLGWASGSLYPLSTYLPLLPLGLALWGLLLPAAGRYHPSGATGLARELRILVKVAAGATILLVLAIYALRLDARLVGPGEISRLWIFLWGLLAGLLLLLESILLQLARQRARGYGFNERRTVIVGTGRPAVELARTLSGHRFWGYRLLGCIAPVAVDPFAPTASAGTPTGAGPELPLLGTVADLPRLSEELVIDEVFFAVPRRLLDDLEELVFTLQELGVRTRFALRLFPNVRARIALEELDGVPLLTFSSGPTNPLHLLVKRLLDLLAASALGLLTLPISLAAALAIATTSPGGVFFRQARCGLAGRRFTLYKFRTMVADAETRKDDLLPLNEMDGPVFKLRSDPRITRIGRLLRRFSLDELPQLWNVFKGDMSLVGPRPPLPEEVARYARWQRRRLSMKPGLTCLWQISGRNEVDFERWMELDLEYIDSWTLWLDLKILLKTLPAVLSGRGAS